MLGCEWCTTQVSAPSDCFFSQAGPAASQNCLRKIMKLHHIYQECHSLGAENRAIVQDDNGQLFK